MSQILPFFSGPEVADSLGNNAPKRKIINDASDKESKCEYFTVITIFTVDSEEVKTAPTKCKENAFTCLASLWLNHLKMC